MKRYFLVLTLFFSILSSNSLDGKKVFETYCWGCHHQTAMAFAPSFKQIAQTRTKENIKAYIISPKSMYKSFGYKRTVMTQFNLTEEELNSITDYILKQKGK